MLAWAGRGPGEDDVQLALDLARLLAAAVEAARLYRRAQEAVAARDEFLSIASHELRTPLTTLLLRLQSLQAGAEEGESLDGEQLRHRLQSALRQTKRLIGLVESLLDVSRVSNGRLHLNREHFDLGDMAREIVQVVEGEHRRLSRRRGADGLLDLRMENDESFEQQLAFSLRQFEPDLLTVLDELLPHDAPHRSPLTRFSPVESLGSKEPPLPRWQNR